MQAPHDFKTGLVSIIIPVYQVEAFLPRCLNSLLDQTYPHWEAICVDDGSTDASGSILDDYAARDSRFLIIHQPNAGVSAARNAALNVVSGEFLTMVDADDSISPDMLEKMVQSMCGVGVDIVACGYRYFNEKGQSGVEPPLWGNRKQVDMVQYLDREIIYSISSFNWTKLYRTSIWCQSAKLRYESGTAYGEDHVVLLRYLMHVRRIACVNLPLYHYYRRAESASRSFEQHRRPASVYARSFRSIAHTVNELSDDTPKEIRGMWHYSVLRRFERTVKHLKLSTHPEAAELAAVVKECRHYLLTGFTPQYYCLWYGIKLHDFAVQGARRLKKKLTVITRVKRWLKKHLAPFSVNTAD